jgi:hypothetical protein
MVEDPLVVSAVAAGSPQEAEYDAVYAAVTATERGRWFLTEYGNRNRHAETHLVLAAIARIEAAVRGDVVPQYSVALWRDLTGVAATIEQARAAIAAAEAPASAVTTALERIQDLAFGLRERAVDPALCDALDAAAREISDACATPAKSGRKVTELLRDLAGRVDTLIRSSLAGRASGEAPSVTAATVVAIAPSPAPVEPIEGNTADTADDNGLSRAALFAMDSQQGENLTEAVAVLATSLTNAAFALDPKSERAAAINGQPEDAGHSGPLVGAPTEGAPRWFIDSPDFVFHRSVPEPEPGSDPEQREPSIASGKTYALLPETRLQVGPQGEPADIFEDAVAPISAPASFAVPSSFAAMPAVAEAPPPLLRISNGPPVRVITRASPSDSLAALRDLSAEELIALFG